MNTPPCLYSFEEEIGLLETYRRSYSVFRHTETYKFERALLYSIALNLAMFLTLFSVFISHKAVSRWDLAEFAATTIFLWILIIVLRIPFSESLQQKNFLKRYFKKTGRNSIRQRLEIGEKELVVKIDDYELTIPCECVRTVIETKSLLVIADYFFNSVIFAKPPTEFLMELKSRVKNYKIKKWK
jgi:hypothetical protein